ASRGGILLGSHLGSFEVLRALGVMQGGFPLKVLMDTRHNQNISRFFDALNPTIAGTVIAPDRPDTLIKIRESLDAGCFVGMSGGSSTTQLLRLTIGLTSIHFGIGLPLVEKSKR